MEVAGANNLSATKLNSNFLTDDNNRRTLFRVSTSQRMIFSQHNFWPNKNKIILTKLCDMQFCSHIIVPRTLRTALMMSQCLLPTMDAASKQDVDANHSTQQENVGKSAGATSLRILCYIRPTPTNTYRQVLGARIVMHHHKKHLNANTFRNANSSSPL